MQAVTSGRSMVECRIGRCTIFSGPKPLDQPTNRFDHCQKAALVLTLFLHSYYEGTITMFNLLLAAAIILPPMHPAAAVRSGEPTPVLVSSEEADDHAINRDRLYLRTAIGPHFSGSTITVVVDAKGSVVSALARPWNQEKDIPLAFLIQAEAMVRGLQFKPFYRRRHPVSVTFERYVIALPPELIPDHHEQFPEVHDWNSVKITLERTLCYGMCPAYKVELHGDGTVLYSGQSHVAVAGDQRASVPQENVVELVKLFEQADYYSLLSEYRSMSTDSPTQITSIEIDGRRKQIVDYIGLDVGMPLSVKKLEAEIDRLSGDARWVHSQVPH
jgi:hypothetical protein